MAVSDRGAFESKARDIAASYGVNPDIFVGLVQTESSWQKNATANDTHVGFTQVSPGAVADVGGSWNAAKNDPVQNLRYGAAYLKQQLDRFSGDYKKALLAYRYGASSPEVGSGKDAEGYSNKVFVNAGETVAGQYGAATQPSQSDYQYKNLVDWAKSFGGSFGVKNQNRFVSESEMPGIHLWATVQKGDWNSAFLIIGAVIGSYSMWGIVRGK